MIFMSVKNNRSSHYYNINQDDLSNIYMIMEIILYQLIM
jgi:hypothetical protein